MRRAALVAALLAALAAPAAAHQLSVFASVDGEAVLVEARFSGGSRPVTGTVRVLDADGALLATLALGEDGTARFPLDPTAHAGGLTIEVETGEGHDDYWVLTPQDIAAGGTG